jgi:putative salt-induced outer membrane protein YdiY
MALVPCGLCAVAAKADSLPAPADKAAPVGHSDVSSSQEPAAADKASLYQTGDHESIEEIEPELRLLLDPAEVLAPGFDLPPDIVYEIEPPQEPLVVESFHEGPHRKFFGFIPECWEGRVELGMNGSSGNSERFATRYGGKLRRQTPRNLFTADILYSNSYARGKENENKLLSEARSEWPFPESPWFSYTHGMGEYDEFTAYRVRLSSDTGLGYQYVQTNVTQLKTRAGIGFSQEINSPNEDFVPEGTIGLSFEHKLTRRQKLIASGDVFPDLRDLQDFRSKANASWEIKIDPDSRLSLRLSAINRYDSTPNGKKKNDLDYSTLVVWEF